MGVQGGPHRTMAGSDTCSPAGQASQLPETGTSSAVAHRTRAPGENWADELMEIVHEPMTHTLDRMKKYSNSLSQVAQLPGIERQQALAIACAPPSLL